jgi:hypothetical protein
MTERQKFLMEQQKEERARRPSSGPCLRCFAYRAKLLPGREGGFHVFCETCAAIERTPATIEADT